MERRSRQGLTVPLRTVANVLTLFGSTTSESSPVPSSTTVELVELVESGTSGTSSISDPPQVALVGAAETKMAKKVKKKRVARVKVETERDIVTN